jgi:hypothetical protein
MPPSLQSILECLHLDIVSLECSPSFEDWAGDAGFDTDSIKALKVFKATEKEQKNIKRWLGPDAYDQFIKLEF